MIQFVFDMFNEELLTDGRVASIRDFVCHWVCVLMALFRPVLNFDEKPAKHQDKQAQKVGKFEVCTVVTGKRFVRTATGKD